jgi:riboflavin biosynthesis pyrimidine reductase
MHGYGPVAKELARHGLLDEFHLWVHPMLAGVGAIEDTLLAEGLNRRLELLAVRPLSSGDVLVSYHAAAAGER